MEDTPLMKQWNSSRSHESRLWSTREQSASSGLSLPPTSAPGHATAAPRSCSSRIGLYTHQRTHRRHRSVASTAQSILQCPSVTVLCDQTARRIDLMTDGLVSKFVSYYITDMAIRRPPCHRSIKSRCDDRSLLSSC